MTRNLTFGLLLGMGVLGLQAQQLAPPPPPPAPLAGLPNPPPVLPTNAPALPDTNGIGPKIQFANLIHDFGKVKAGEAVNCTYVFTNTGDKLLELSNVQPQCGCTAAGDWTRKVEPGETGKIPIKFDTGHYAGQVFKQITVACNDRTQPMVVLQLKGNIWKPIDIVPPYTVLNIQPDMTNAAAVVKIVNNMDTPLEVMAPECANKGFTVKLQTNAPGKEFQLTISAVPPLTPGTIQGKITVKTSATNTPTMDLPFWANVQAPIMVFPATIMVPSTPLTNKVTPTVTIQNNTTNALVLSEPSVNFPGAEVQIRELQPGRIFSALITLPEGFDIKPERKPVLTIKTSNPRFPQLEVPIAQMARPLTSVPPLNQPSLPAAGLKVRPTAQLLPTGKIVPTPATQ